jgi:biotin transport system substrate-specific component
VTAITTTHRTLVDTLPVPSTKVRSAIAIVGFALLTAACAQVSFHLPWTPVPVTGQTFAVLLSGAALGAGRGAASQVLYVALGAIGLPFYAEATHGWSVTTGSTAGYLVGFIVAAAVVGRLAERGEDRRPLTSLAAMVMGSAVIYVCGAVWLAHSIHVSAADAVDLGVSPFLIGDAAKAALAGLAFPAAWALVGPDTNE